MDQFFWGITEAEQIKGAHREASRASSAANNAVSEIKALTSQVDRLTIACQAMWEIVRDQTNITEKDLAEKITEIDLRDGVEDGKIGPQIIECPSCGRNSNSKRSSCVWCGASIEGEHIFEG